MGAGRPVHRQDRGLKGATSQTTVEAWARIEGAQGEHLMKNSQVMTLASSIIAATGATMRSDLATREIGTVLLLGGLVLFIGSAITMARNPGS